MSILTYEWMKTNKQHFDLSDSLRDDMKDNTNKKVLGKFKDENNSLPVPEFLALSPKVYTMIHHHFDKDKHATIENNTKKLKGVSKAVVKNNITHNDYCEVLATNQQISKSVVGIRSFQHQLYTYKQDKVALTSYYDKMFMKTGNECYPFGYYGNNKNI